MVRKNKSWGDRQGVSLPRSTRRDALGNPIRFILTGGQCSDDTKAIDLIEGFELQKLLADKGYDANYIVEYVGIDKAVIPVHENKSQRI